MNTPRPSSRPTPLHKITAQEIDALILSRRLPPISRAAPPLAWADTAHDAMLDDVGGGGNVHLLRRDGSDQVRRPAPLPAPLELAADPAAEMWHTPHRRSSPAFGTSAPFVSAQSTVSAPPAQRQRSADKRAANDGRHQERIPTWALGLGALVVVATIAASSLAPWGWAVKLWL